MDIVEQFIQKRSCSRTDFVRLLEQANCEAAVNRLRAEAVRLRRYYYGNKVYTRGLIEFTNYCKINCLYCGIRRENRSVDRFRLTEEEILQCCENGYALGFRTFVLQGGEDPYDTDDRLTQIVRAIRSRYPDCAITLSVGERSRDSYAQLREA